MSERLGTFMWRGKIYRVVATSRDYRVAQGYELNFKRQGYQTHINYNDYGVFRVGIRKGG